MNHVRRNIVANYFGQGWGGFMAVAFLPLYVQYLGVEAYGLIGLFAVLQAMIIILDVGIGNTLNREMANFAHGKHSAQAIRDLLRRLEIICYVIAGIVVTVGWIFSHSLAREWLKAERLSPDEVAFALFLMALVAALRLCEGLYRGALYGLEDQVWYNLTYSVISTLRYVGALGILISISQTIKAFFLWQAFISLVTLIALGWRVYRSIPKNIKQKGRPDEPSIKILKYASGIMGIAFLTMIFLQLDKLVLSRLVSLKELGYYSLAATAANVIFMLIIPVAQAIFPQLVKFSADKDQFKISQIYRKATKLVVVLTSCASMLLCFHAGGVIYVWSGNQDLITNSAPLLAILALGSFLNGLSYLPHQLQVAHGRTRLLLAANTAILLLYIPLVLIAVPPYGVQGAAWIWVAMNAAYMLGINFMAHKKVLCDQKWSWYFFDILLPTAGAILVIVLAKEIQPDLHAGRLYWFVFLVLTGLAALVVSGGLAMTVKNGSSEASSKRNT